MADFTAKTGTAGFVPELWQAALIESFKNATVFGQSPVASDRFTGDIKRLGDTVHVGTIGKISVTDYNPNADLTIGDLTVTDTALKINKAKSFGFYVEDVENLQTAGALDDPAVKAAVAEISDAVDKDIAEIFKNDAGSKLTGVKVHLGYPESAPKGDGAKQTPFEVLVSLATKLNQNNVPNDGNRYVVVGPQFYSGLLLDERVTKVDVAGTAEGLKNGIVARILGFDILLSNNIPTTGGRELICAGYNGAITLAMQINKVEKLRAEKRFADIYKGLAVYGAKAFMPKALATADCSFT